MIKTRALSKNYQSVQAVRHLDLKVEKELFVFLGPNGAGKTTTIKMLTGLLPPTSGEISIAGIDLLANPQRAKQIIGLVPEQPHLYEKLCITEYLQLVVSLYQVPVAEASRRMNMLFEWFQLAGRERDMIEELSHGMKRKVALIGALIHDPQVLFLDEPTIGLDPQSAHILWKLLHDFVSRGRTVFMSTHILELAEKVCDRIGIIHQGELLQADSLERLYHKYPQAENNLEQLFLQLTDSDQIADYGALW
ncbi:ATP-binding cassette domain-containing protein [candidate division KSB1 bacterium]|nr:ATP-binding cassette domain-containing protein [candidate division KSB1 bacterium]